MEKHLYRFSVVFGILVSLVLVYTAVSPAAEISGGRAVYDQYNGSDDQDGCGQGVVVHQPCPGLDSKPILHLDVKMSTWHSFHDYRSGTLTVVYEISNRGDNNANQIRILSSTGATENVSVLTMLPLSVSSLAPGSYDTFKLTYRVPSGIGSYSAMVHASSMTDDGNTHYYPSEAYISR